MNREPSIHVTESVLAQQLEKILEGKNIKTIDYKALAEELAIACSPFSLSSRSIRVSNEKLLQKTTKVKASTLTDAALFAHILQAVRRQLRHRGITQIKAGTPDWLILKDITNNANQFLAEFNIEKKAGYTKYLQVAISKMQKYSLNKIPNMHSSICNEYEAMIKLERDPTPSKTNEAYTVYQTIITQKTGMPNLGYDELPEKMAVFVDIKNEASKLKCPISTYIRAQFEAFGFKDGIPDPLQMIGPKALGRVQKYCFENNINLNAEPKKTIDFSKIKKTK